MVESASLICSCNKKQKKVRRQTRKYCWITLAEDFKIVFEVSVDGMSCIIFVSTLHLNRLP